MSFDHCDLVPIIVRLLPTDLRVRLGKKCYERRAIGPIKWEKIIFTHQLRSTDPQRGSGALPTEARVR